MVKPQKPQSQAGKQKEIQKHKKNKKIEAHAIQITYTAKNMSPVHTCWNSPANMDSCIL